MASIHNEDIIKKLIKKTTVPLILRQFVDDWPLCWWNLEKWSSIFGDKAVPFRCMKRNFISTGPCWERMCSEKLMTFHEFVGKAEESEEWMYFDYKYLQQWFNGHNELIKEVSWKKFGHPDKNASHSTLWIGSKGAHTPAHQDTYGYNIITQLYGKKRWILFPPETGNLKPTRVPYEESSVYSELNFYCPSNLDSFNALTGARLVELSAGDALVVPRGWWHYVQNIDNVNIALNIWLPHEKDTSTQVSEALVKILVAQLCKDLPQETAKLLVNPNEDDISETPLAVLFLQLDTVAKTYLDNKKKLRRVKRQRTCDIDSDTVSQAEDEIDLKKLLDNKENKLELATMLNTNDLIDLLKDNIKMFVNDGKQIDDDEIEGATDKLHLTKAVIDAFCQSNVIELVKQNLCERLG
ncbi:PREDICTED: HSPB1-associated protein 1 [Papilio polytes]|uniref:HSPB1-associated protein 1 n=1 Tax=Papilio polytes TaxID=76194 RepID=UPI0006768EE9|nr:PREDICTED: HSPB1-associated protein 1 [Papilio polytes]